MAATDFEVTVNTKDFDQSIRRIIAEMKEVDKTSKDTGNSIDGMGKKIAGAAAAYFSVQQAQQFLNKVIEIRGQFQQLDIAFTTMLQGNREASSKLMNELTEFASVTPFGLMDAASGAKQLLAYGFEVENVVKDMEMLGNVASGVSAPLNDIVYLYGTLKASGRVATMDIRQFAGRGIPIYRELAKVLGVAEGEINDLVSAGKVGFNDIEKAFKRMTGEGGTFYNLMREQSKSLPGQISNLEDSIDMMFNEIGAASEEYISKGIEGVAWLVENYEKVGRTLLELVGAYGAYKVALVSVKALMSGMTAAELAHSAAIVAKEKAQKLLNATMLKNPYVLAAAGVAALAYGIYKLVTYQTEAEKAQQALNKAFENTQAEIAIENTQINILFSKLQRAKEGTQEFKQAKEEILSRYGKYLEPYNEEIRTLTDLASAYDIIKTKAKEYALEKGKENYRAKAADTYLTNYESGSEDLKKTIKNGLDIHKEEISNILSEDFRSIIDLDEDSITEEAFNILMEAFRDNNLDDRNIQKLIKAFNTSTDASGMKFNNAVELALNKLKESQKIYEDSLDKADKLFGGVDKSAFEVYTPDDPAKNQNKKQSAKTINQLEEELKSKKEELGKLTEIEITTGKGVKIRQEINDLENRIARAKEGGTTTSETKTNLSADYAREMAKQVADAQLEIRQASIDAMNEGFAKENAQLELNYHKQLQEITNMESEMVEKLRDYEEKKQGKAFDRSSITAENLSADQKAIVNTMYWQANAEYLKDSEELNKTMLDKYRTYFEQRKAIEEHYKQEEANVRAAGGTDFNVEEVITKRDEDLAAIDEQFAMRSDEYEAWCNYIADLSLVELQRLLAQAKLELDKASPDDEKIAQKRATVNKLQEKVNKKTAEQNVGKRASNRSVKEWKELEEVLTDCISKFDDIGDAIGGAAGEAIKTAGTLASSTISMVNGMMQFVQMCSNGVIVAGNATATAMKIIESASIVLTIISTAIQFATMIASLFSNEEDDTERIAKLEAAISRLEWERNNPEILKMWRERGKAIFDVYRALSLYLSLQRMSRIAYIPEKIAAQTRNWDSAVKKLADSYKNLSYSEATILTEEKYKNVGSDLEHIAEQQMLLAQKNRQLKNVDDKDEDVDWAQIEANQQKIEELRLEAAQLINGYVEEVIGGSAHDIATKLGDAFWEAAREGEDAMNALKGEVDDILGDIVKRMLISSTLEEPIAKLFDKKKEEWFNGGIYQGANAVKESMMNFDQELIDATQPYRDAMEQLPEDLKDKLFNDADRQSASRGIATASQESVDENNARLTTIQAHTASIAGNVNEMALQIKEQRIISERTSQLVDNIRMNVTLMVKHLQGIETNTGDTNNKLDKINSTLSDIQLKGIKMK